MTDLTPLIDRLEKAEADDIEQMCRRKYREFVEKVNRTTDSELADAALLKALQTKESAG